MESLLNRYRSITVLVLVIFAQFVLLAVQVKNDQNLSVIRYWTVTAVSPVARILEWGRHSSVGFIRNYVLLRDASEENRRLRADVDRLKVENVLLKNELNLSDRAKALEAFAARTPSKTLAATVFMSAAGSDSNAVFVDRGSLSGVERGMGVITPDGIVGKVIRTSAMSSMVSLVSDQDFAAGVATEGGQVRGILRGQGKPMCKVDYVPFEDKIKPGDLLFTSGDDHMFPRGFPVGVVKSVSDSSGQAFKDILVEPSGLRHGVPEDVLIIIEGVHQDIPDAPPPNQPVYVNPTPPPTTEPEENATPASGGTEADRARAQAKAIGESQGHVFGSADGKIPNFNPNLPPAPSAAQAGAPAAGAAPAPKAGDNVRRANQAAGAPPGGKQN
jgi:rod shape-determining protein MreC